MLKGLVQYETRMGEAYNTSGGRITPFSKALIIKIPGNHGGLVWNRPASVLVTTGDGQERVIPVVDVTRIVQWSLAGAILAWGIVFLILTHIKGKTLKS